MEILDRVDKFLSANPKYRPRSPREYRIDRRRLLVAWPGDRFFWRLREADCGLIPLNHGLPWAEVEEAIAGTDDSYALIDVTVESVVRDGVRGRAGRIAPSAALEVARSVVTVYATRYGYTVVTAGMSRFAPLTAGRLGEIGEPQPVRWDTCVGERVDVGALPNSLVESLGLGDVGARAA